MTTRNSHDTLEVGRREGDDDLQGEGYIRRERQLGIRVAWDPDHQKTTYHADSLQGTPSFHLQISTKIRLQILEVQRYYVRIFESTSSNGRSF